MEEQTTKKQKFWEIRSKHGRDMLFSSPELMWHAACEYFNWVDENPWEEEQLFAYQGGVTRESAKKKVIYTWQGLCLYLHSNTAYFRQFKLRMKKEPELAEHFSPVIEMIEDVIFNQQFNGAGSGFFKENIISRYLGLKDKTELSNPEGQQFEVTLKIT